MRIRTTLFALMLTATPLLAQSRTSSRTAKSAKASASASAANFSVGETLIGPSVGLGGLGQADMSIGGRFEHGVKALPDFANGTLGIGVQLDYYSYTYPYPGGTWKYRYVPIGATANYHFALTNRKVDPYVGLGLGYAVASVSGGVGGTASSDIYLIANVGGRYYLSDRMAVQAEVGTGVATLNLGLMFRL